MNDASLGGEEQHQMRHLGSIAQAPQRMLAPGGSFTGVRVSTLVASGAPSPD